MTFTMTAPVAPLLKAAREGARARERIGCMAQTGWLVLDGTGGRVEYRGVDHLVRLDVEGATGTGAVALGAEGLIGALMGCEEAEVEIALVDTHVHFSSGRFVAKVIAGRVDDCPELSPSNWTHAFPLAEGVLDALLRFTSPCISAEETRYYLNGVAFEVEGDRLRAVTTDGHRLATRTVGVSGSHEPMAWPSIVPTPAVKIAMRLFGRGEVTVCFSDAHVQIEGKGASLKSKLIDGKFPDWRRVVPAKDGAPAVALRAAPVRRFLAAAKMGATAYSRALRLELKGDAAFLGSSDPDVGKMETRVDLSTRRGDAIVFGVNGKYLDAMFDMFKAPALRLEVKDPGSPIRIDAEGDEHSFAVLMPMRV